MLRSALVADWPTARQARGPVRFFYYGRAGKTYYALADFNPLDGSQQTGGPFVFRLGAASWRLVSDTSSEVCRSPSIPAQLRVAWRLCATATLGTPSTGPEDRPEQLPVETGPDRLTQLAWWSWGGPRAQAFGLYGKYPVGVTATRPRRCLRSDRLIYTRISFRFEGKPPRGSRPSYPLSALGPEAC